MKFRKGNKIEVLKKTKETCDSWFPGEIISEGVSKFAVRYESFHNDKGELIMENVSRENVRPQPPSVKREEKWVLGDTVEVFDCYCWKIGKIVKVIQNDRYVIRFSGSIQLKDFHKSSLRIQQAWEGNKWVPVEKVREDKHNNRSSVQHNLRVSQGLARKSLHPGFHPNTWQKNDEQVKTLHPMKSLKRIFDNNVEISLDDAVRKLSGSKRKVPMRLDENERLPMRTPSLFEQVDAVSYSNAKVMRKVRSFDVEAENPNCFSQRPLNLHVQVPEYSNGCSVASCSSNDFPEYTSQNSHKSFENLADSSFGGAESFCPVIPERKNIPSSAEDDSEDDVHTLELHAYKSTMHALYASGPLSWEQEALLTNLRLNLHISNEEHLLQLRQLLSTQVL